MKRLDCGNSESFQMRLLVHSQVMKIQHQQSSSTGEKPFICLKWKERLSEPETISFWTMTVFWHLSSVLLQDSPWSGKSSCHFCVCVCVSQSVAVLILGQESREPVWVASWAMVPQRHAHEWGISETRFNGFKILIDCECKHRCIMG